MLEMAAQSPASSAFFDHGSFQNISCSFYSTLWISGDLSHLQFGCPVSRSGGIAALSQMRGLDFFTAGQIRDGRDA